MHHGRRAFLAASAGGLATALAGCLTAPGGPAGGTGSPALELAEGYRYDVVVEAGAEMDDGTPYPGRPDLNVVTPAGLVSTHEYGGRDAPDGSVTLVPWEGRPRTLAAGLRHPCSGGPTPAGTVLVCEEVDGGLVYEVELAGGGRPRPEMGRFRHEDAESVDGAVFLTEDADPGHVYRFDPDGGEGGLWALAAGEGWVAVDPRRPGATARAAGATSFDRPEGLTARDGSIYFAETGTGTVHEVDPERATVRPAATGLDGPDNLAVSPAGDLYVCEDGHGVNRVLRLAGGDPDVVLRTRDEPTGIEFGRGRMYLNLQGRGVTVAIDAAGSL